MTKRTIILLTTGLLLFAVLTTGYIMSRNTPAKFDVANAPVSTGISVIVGQPLKTELHAKITDSNNQLVKNVVFEKNASRFNIDLTAGVYSITVSSKDNSVPPLPPETITITDGVLSELYISIPNTEEE